MGMTQNTNTTARTVANLTASIRRTTGVVRDNHARELINHVGIDLVSMLVGASDRYHSAERALDEAEATMINAMDAIHRMIDPDPVRNTRYLVEAIATTARCYVSALDDGTEDDRARARELFIEATGDVAGMMTTTEGRAEVPILAFAAMSSAMAERTEQATKDAYRAIQTVINNKFN